MLAIHTESKVVFAGCEIDRAIKRIAWSARGSRAAIPGFYGGKYLGHFVGGSHRNEVFRFMGWVDYASLEASMAAGKVYRIVFNKTPASNSQWFDLWNIGDLPVGGGYPGTALSATAFTNVSTGAMWHPNVSPSTKHITETTISVQSGNTVTPLFMLYDRVIHYPTVAVSTVAQNFGNTTPAPRYNGAGLPGMQVAAVCQSTVGATPSTISALSYVDNTGAAASVPTSLALNVLANGSAETIVCPSNSAGIGTVDTLSPFLPLAAGSSGVRSLTQIIFSANNTGSMCMVLAYPIAYFTAPASGISVNVDQVLGYPNLTRVYDDAALALFLHPAGGTGNIIWTGTIEVAWS